MRWNRLFSNGWGFILHVILFAVAHTLFIVAVGVTPASELPSGSYFEHIGTNIWSHGINIYLSDTINSISQIWKSILIIHGLIDLSYVLFPSKKAKQHSLTNKAFSSDSKVDAAVPLKALKKEKKEKAISSRLGWLFVFIGGALEIVWASSMKYNFVSPLIVLLALLVSFDLVIRAAKVIPIGTAYGVFTGIGTIGLVIVEAVTEGYIRPIKLGVIILLLVFIILLKLTGDRKAEG